MSRRTDDLDELIAEARKVNPAAMAEIEQMAREKAARMRAAVRRKQKRPPR